MAATIDQRPSLAVRIGLLAGLATLTVLPIVVPIYYVELGTTALVAAMLALSLQLLVGCTGLVSLGHGAFYGLAAYTVYLVSKDAALSMWVTLPLAMIVTGLAGLIVGAISLRTRGFFFLMVTLAFGQMIYFVFHDTKLGGGADGAYFSRPIIGAFGWVLDLPRKQRPLGTYYVALIQLTVMYLALSALMGTLFGRVLTGIRTNEHRMQALGFDTYRHKLAAFVVASVLAGMAGHMWAMHRALVNPDLTGWHRSAEALLMILLGGLGSLAGPIVGAFAFTALGEVAGLITERKLLVEGLVILALVVALPGGLASLWPSSRFQQADTDRPSVLDPTAADGAHQTPPDTGGGNG